MSTNTFSIAQENRLDAAMAASTGLSRSHCALLIRSGKVTVNEKTADKPSFTVHENDTVTWEELPVQETGLVPQDIPLTILYEDEHLAVIDKPCGMVVHPAAGNNDGTLVNALMFHLDNLSGIGGEKRPGIVHRLDKDTSGLILVAKDDMTHIGLSAQLAERKIEKHYRSIVWGKMKEESGKIILPIGRSKTDRKKMAVIENGRPSHTEWKLLDERKDMSYLDVHILTGRTHQIRVHMRAINHPVLGDPIYGYPSMPSADRLMLHAYSLAFVHPVFQRSMNFISPCPFEGFKLHK